MSGRGPRATTTLVGPNRVVLALATGGLVALASAGTALLIVQGTSAVDPVIALTPPSASAQPAAPAPGVVVLPSGQAALLGGVPPRHRRSFAAPQARVLARGARPHPHAQAQPQPQPQVPARPSAQPSALPAALPFVDVPGTSTAAALLRSGAPGTSTAAALLRSGARPLAPQAGATVTPKQLRRASDALPTVTEAAQDRADKRAGHRTWLAGPAASDDRQHVKGPGKKGHAAHGKGGRTDHGGAHSKERGRGHGKHHRSARRSED